MPSFNAVNYSLRPNKAIQRHLIFDGLRHVERALGANSPVYIGLGSIWFTDFIMAHRLLKIRDMISIESDNIGYQRACFNRPYATVRVIFGSTGQVLPQLYHDSTISARPWVMWLDYDGFYNESIQADIRSVLENAPQKSVFLVTFNGATKYGDNPAQKLERLRFLFGDLVPDSMTKRSCKGDRLSHTLANLTSAYMTSVTLDLARSGGFIPAFRVLYRDTSPMVTVGGLLPTACSLPAAKACVADPGWKCLVDHQIAAPHLTLRETATLQSQLPSDRPLTRRHVRAMGFDLEPEQIDAFVHYYNHYPTFAEVVA